MQIILSDYNCEGQADLIFQTLRYTGYLSFMALELLTFEDIDLHHIVLLNELWTPDRFRKPVRCIYFK